MESLFLAVFVAVFGIVRAQPDLNVRFLENTVETALHSQLAITCQINITVLRLINDFDVEIVRQAIDNSEIVLSRGAKRVAAETQFYNVMISENSGFGVTIKFEFIKVRGQDEGRYLCRAKPNSNDTVLEEASLDITILKPVEKIYLQFGKSPLISRSLVEPFEVDPGNHAVVCTAEGSNPAATANLYLDGKPIQKTSNEMKKMASPLTQFRTVVKGIVPLIFANSVGTIECAAGALVGNNISVKFPFKTRVFPDTIVKQMHSQESGQDDPEITCNDTEAYPGQKNPVITCIVDYAGLKIKSFRYELADKDSDKTSATFEEVSQEALSSTETRVQLKLTTAEAWHFETEFYMVVEHEDGHITRQTVRLHKVPGHGTAARESGDNPINGSPALILLLAFFMWLL